MPKKNAQKKKNSRQKSKREGVFWERIAAAKNLVFEYSLKRKRSQHRQKKMPLKMLEGVRRKKAKRIKKERELDIQAGIIYNSLHGRDMEHFTIQRIANENKRKKLTRMDFGKTTGIMKAEKRNYEKTLQGREKRREEQKERSTRLRWEGREGFRKRRRQRRGQSFTTQAMREVE